MGVRTSETTKYADSLVPRDTIVAVATAPGRAGVAIVRVSGPRSIDALCLLTGADAPPSRFLRRFRFRDPVQGDVIDDGLAAIFPAPASFTGEDVVECHIHGGRAVSSALIEALLALPGLRPAEAGEFSRRAFENGKMDLTIAEGIADLVDAETAEQRRQALRQMDGALGRLYEGWRRDLLVAMAHLEATIDFSDEPLPPDLDRSIRLQVADVAAAMDVHLADGRRGERLRDGVTVAIVGAPNAGKSSLLNRLARRDAAIVNEIAGTTRDVIEVHLDLGGFPVTLADTAGLRETEDAVEKEGVRRARHLAAGADARVVVLDAVTWPQVPAGLSPLIDDQTVLVMNKIDLVPEAGTAVLEGRACLAVSAATGRGIDALEGAIGKMAANLCGRGDTPALTRVRHRQAIEDARTGLHRFATVMEPELAAEELRLACRAIGRITGHVTIEEMLDVIFREFCIGK